MPTPPPDYLPILTGSNLVIEYPYQWRRYSDMFLACHGICPCCLHVATLTTEQRGCAYADENSNWLTSCAECHKEDDEYWHEMWTEYRASQGF